VKIFLHFFSLHYLGYLQQMGREDFSPYICFLTALFMLFATSGWQYVQWVYSYRFSSLHYSARTRSMARTIEI
jgi:hypothetical protein